MQNSLPLKDLLSTQKSFRQQWVILHIHVLPASHMTKYTIPKYLEEAFEIDFSFTDTTKNKYDFYVAGIGELKIVDGKIIACDPLLYNNDLPFNATFPVGHFPIELAVVNIDSDERVAFSRIKFSSENPTIWNMAVCEGQRIEDLETDDIFGYGVDAGIGAFMDTSGATEFSEFLMEELDNYQIIINEMQKTYKDTWSCLLWKKNNCNVALFSSGWGDGFYATYIGYDCNNNICRLVTDFGVI